MLAVVDKSSHTCDTKQTWEEMSLSTESVLVLKRYDPLASHQCHVEINEATFSRTPLKSPR